MASTGKILPLLCLVITAYNCINNLYVIKFRKLDLLVPNWMSTLLTYIRSSDSYSNTPQIVPSPVQGCTRPLKSLSERPVAYSVNLQWKGSIDTVHFGQMRHVLLLSHDELAIKANVHSFKDKL